MRPPRLFVELFGKLDAPFLDASDVGEQLRYVLLRPDRGKRCPRFHQLEDEHLSAYSRVPDLGASFLREDGLNSSQIGLSRLVTPCTITSVVMATIAKTIAEAT